MFGIMEAACLSALFFLAGELGSSVIQSLNNLRDRTAKRLRQEAGATKAAGAFSNGAQDELAGRHNIQNEAPPAADPQGEDHPTPGPSSPPFMYNGFNPIWEPVGFHMTIYTDAAGLNLQNYGGWAGWSTFNGQRLVARGIWTGDLLFDHSTAQELMAVFNTIQSFNRGDELRGKRILIKTDNQAVFYIINRAGSRDSHVHDLCKQLFWYCIHFNIRIQAVWIPRELNSFADYYSKLTDSSDWRLDTKVFRHLSSLWGGFDIL